MSLERWLRVKITEDPNTHVRSLQATLTTAPEDVMPSGHCRISHICDIHNTCICT